MCVIYTLDLFKRISPRNALLNKPIDNVLHALQKLFVYFFYGQQSGQIVAKDFSLLVSDQAKKVLDYDSQEKSQHLEKKCRAYGLAICILTYDHIRQHNYMFLESSWNFFFLFASNFLL